MKSHYVFSRKRFDDFVILHQHVYLLRMIQLNALHAGNFFYIFLSSADIFQNHFFSNNSFRNTIRVTNSLYPDQARHFVGPDLDPNYLQRISADDRSGH